MIRFGPSGNSRSFYEEGNKSTLQAAAFVSSRGLNAYEYSFGRGVNMREETARAIGEQMTKHQIAVSCHAPYYINLAGSDESIVNSVRYVEQSVVAINHMGGRRVVLHSGTQGKNDRRQVIELIKERYRQLVEYLDSKGYDYVLCPEAMGRFSQIGSYQEILEICAVSSRLTPCFDFGHINCTMLGALTSADDYRRIFDDSIAALGEERIKHMHIHFSKIQYGQKGELRHLDFTDDKYGPEFEPLAVVLHEYKLEPVIICESADNMAEDAAAMLGIYNALA